MKCLSRMTGNCHVRFLGGKAVVTPLTQPITLRWWSVCMQDSRLYGVELDSITGRIAKKLYPQADITVAGFETTDRRDFYDLAVGNVPFSQYKVNDKA